MHKFASHGTIALFGDAPKSGFGSFREAFVHGMGTRSTTTRPVRLFS